MAKNQNRSFGDILGATVSFVENNPQIIQLGTDAVAAAIDYVRAAFAAHQAGVLNDEQIQAAWNLVTAGVVVSDNELTEAIRAWRIRHPVGATGPAPEGIA